MNSKERTKAHFDAISGRYDNSHDGKFVNPMYGEIYKEVMRLGHDGENVLDLGCGTGNMIEMLSEKTNLKLTGVDLSEAMIEEAKKRFKDKEAKFVVGDVENLPFDDNSFNIIVCNASFHHYTKPKKAMSEIRRVLKSGGYLVIGDPTNKIIPMPVVNFFVKFAKEGDYHIYSQMEMEELVKEYGFTVDKNKMITKKSFMICAELQ